MSENMPDGDFLYNFSTNEIALFVIAVLIVAVFLGNVTAEIRGNKATRKWYEKYLSMLNEAAVECVQCYPWMAAQVADIIGLYDEEIALHLKWKRHPARKASEEVSLIAKEKKSLQKQNKLLQYQLEYYETLFPWLEEFKKVDPKTGWEYTHEITGEELSEYDSLRQWISPEEYQKLSTCEKYQLALDRYNARKKTDWDAGIEYERFIGYVFESLGCKVHYTGARLGLEDMGRDLIVEYPERTLVVQCKRWSMDKIIHEKHIFQLFGTTMLMHIKEPDVNYEGVFITTASLSDLSKKCAEQLEIKVVENYAIESYPMIKCNCSVNGEKIYHLPMDQQYDRVQISGKPGAMFAMTVEEAERNGFRRAYHWNPNKSEGN